MISTAAAAESKTNDRPVGPFTGFGNFLHKELLDWWKSWRLVIVFLIPTFIETMTVFFAYTDMRQMAEHFLGDTLPAEPVLAAYAILHLFTGLNAALFIFIVVFSTMGLLTAEKATGTLAWNLTKPLGRTGLFVAKWLAATLVLWLAIACLPVLVASVCMTFYHHVTPDYSKMAPVVAIALAWIGFWVLMVLTISLGFQSQGAVGGIAIACWIVPFLFSALLGEIFGEETKEWILDRFAPRSPFWAFPLVADKDLIWYLPGAFSDWKTIWLYAFAGWTIVLSVFSLRIFNRQEIGS